MLEDTKFLSQRAQSHLLESARVKHAVAGGGADFFAAPYARAAGTPGTAPHGRTFSPLLSAIVEAARAIADAFRSGGKLLLCGNGGSAADCQHMAAEFTNVLDKKFVRGPLPAIALTTDTSFLTAFVNDFKNFEEIFSRQVRGLGKAGDALIGISTSGTSANVIRALEEARQLGMRTIALSGAGGDLERCADIAIAVPSAVTAHIQEAHLAIEHAICDLVEQILFAKDTPPTAQPMIEPEAV